MADNDTLIGLWDDDLDDPTLEVETEKVDNPIVNPKNNEDDPGKEGEDEEGLEENSIVLSDADSEEEDDGEG